MKRYRVMNFDFDSNAGFLNVDISPNLPADVREGLERQKRDLIDGLLQKYGRVAAEAKIQNLQELGNAPFSILAFQNKFLRQTRDAFVIGAYYPALTGACALGERILNHLLLQLRDGFIGTPEYKRIYDKESIDNWITAIEILDSWGILLPTVVSNYQTLWEIRNQRAIHFNRETDHNEREFALEALKCLQAIIGDQFGAALGLQPWFIPGTHGWSFIRKEAEEWPFIRTIYLPRCLLVGPYHELEFMQNETGLVARVVDDFDYGDQPVSDEQFVEMYNNYRSMGPHEKAALRGAAEQPQD